MADAADSDPPVVDTGTPPAVDDSDPPDPGDDTDLPAPFEKPPFVGALNISEPTAMQGFCAVHDTVYGTVEVRGAVVTRLDDLACLKRVYGNLNVLATGLLTIALPNLEVVSGSLFVSGPRSASALQFPLLREVGGNLTIGGGTPLSNLVVVDMTSLERVASDLRMEDSRALASVSFPALGEVGRHLWVRRNDALGLVSAPGLQLLGGALRIEDNLVLQTMSLPSLLDVGRLTTGELAIEDNALLAQLDGLGAVRSVSGSLVVRRNPSLATARAFALADQLDTLGGVVAIEENGP